MNLQLTVRIPDLDREFERAEADFKMEVAKILAQIGEDYVSTSKANGGYKDITGNLRRANSYRVYFKGGIVFESIGLSETGDLFERVKSGAELEFIVGNGMEYASFVEGKGFDVSTSGILKVIQAVNRMT
jgi:hypothetical protein